MTHTQQIAMLIEAAGPLSAAVLLRTMGMHKKLLHEKLRRLMAYEVLSIRNINGTRHYAMWQA